MFPEEPRANDWRVNTRGNGYGNLEVGLVNVTSLADLPRSR